MWETIFLNFVYPSGKLFLLEHLVVKFVSKQTDMEAQLIACNAAATEQILSFLFFVVLIDLSYALQLAVEETDRDHWIRI